MLPKLCSLAFAHSESRVGSNLLALRSVRCGVSHSVPRGDGNGTLKSLLFAELDSQKNVDAVIDCAFDEARVELDDGTSGAKTKENKKKKRDRLRHFAF